VERFVSERILPRIPCMIGVDHSLTAGAFKAVSDHYGKENVALIVLDSHTDAVPMSVLADAIQYDIDNNPASLHDRHDPFLYNRADSVNASSFIHHLLAEGTVLPENLFLIGVGDYPEKRALRIKDPRIARYVGVYRKMKQDGVTLLTKKDCASSPTKLKTLLRKLKTACVYISVDMDIGARNAVEGVRFRDRQGLQEKQIYRIAEAIGHLFSQRVRLAGLDITEINPRRAGGMFSSGQDKTYRIAANLIGKIAFGR
jgi:arginase family enzyme